MLDILRDQIRSLNPELNRAEEETPILREACNDSIENQKAIFNLEYSRVEEEVPIYSAAFKDSIEDRTTVFNLESSKVEEETPILRAACKNSLEELVIYPMVAKTLERDLFVHHFGILRIVTDHCWKVKET